MALADEFVRVVARPRGELELGRTLEGRGAWLCRLSPGCVDLAAKRRTFAKALRAEVSAAAVERLRASLDHDGHERPRHDTSAPVGARRD